MRFLLRMLVLSLLFLSVFSTIAVDSLYAEEGEGDSATTPVPSSAIALPPLPFSKASMALPLSMRNTVTKADARRISARGLLPSPDPEQSPAVVAARAAGEKWIKVDLSEQKTYAYEGERLLRTFIVSTGVPDSPTVTGEFRMWVRTPIQDMYGGSRASGDYYYLEDVPWVQYFYQDYGFHGTYWHDNFGQPMSRGCVNMTIDDAKWLFDWAFPQWGGEAGWLSPTEENATLVIVHE